MKQERQIFFFGDEIPWTDTTPGMRRQILGYDNQIMMVRLRIDKGAVGVEHAHFHTQTTCIISGKYEFTVEGVKRIVGAGDALYFEPNSKHGFTCLEAGEVIDCFSPMREDFVK